MRMFLDGGRTSFGGFVFLYLFTYDTEPVSCDDKCGKLAAVYLFMHLRGSF